LPGASASPVLQKKLHKYIYMVFKNDVTTLSGVKYFGTTKALISRSVTEEGRGVKNCVMSFMDDLYGGVVVKIRVQYF